jgi:hypothetical protein
MSRRENAWDCSLARSAIQWGDMPPVVQTERRDDAGTVRLLLGGETHRPLSGQVNSGPADLAADIRNIQDGCGSCPASGAVPILVQDDSLAAFAAGRDNHFMLPTAHRTRMSHFLSFHTCQSVLVPSLGYLRTVNESCREKWRGENPAPLPSRERSLVPLDDYGDAGRPHSPLLPCSRSLAKPDTLF